MESAWNEIGKLVLADLRKTIRIFQDIKKDITVKFEGIEEAIFLCEKYFASVCEYLSKETVTVSKEESDEVLVVLQKSFDGFKDTDFIKKYENRKINKEVKPSFVFEDRLAYFPSNYIEPILSNIQKDATISILPYLMASYYLNSADISTFLVDIHSKENYTPGSVYRIFEEQDSSEKTSINNMSRDISMFARRFTLDTYIEKYIKKKSGKTLAETRIKSVNDYDAHIRAFFCSSRYPYKSALLLTDLQLRGVFDAFVYSLCTLACANSTKVATLIDYKLSFKLFNEHTRAFHVSCFPPSWLEFENDELKKSHATMRSASLFNLALEVDTEKFKAEVENQPSSCHRYLQKCGIDISWLTCDAEKYSNEWYKQTSLLFAYYLHPMNYLGWKKNSEQFPAMEPKHDDR